MISELQKQKMLKEMVFSASLSSGAGGQHVNKVNTKVELRFHIDNSEVLNDKQKEILKEKLAKRINKEGFILFTSQTERSQLKNKEKVTARFFSIFENALKPVKKRKPTKPSKASKEKRLTNKRIQSEKKAGRKDVDL